MAAVEVALNHAVDGIKNKVGEFALYDTSGDPDASSGTTGELTGGTYARKAATYGATSAGSADISSSVVFDGPGTSTTVQYVGFWSNDTTPVYLGSATLSANKTIGPGDTLTITSAPITVTAA